MRPRRTVFYYGSALLLIVLVLLGMGMVFWRMISPPERHETWTAVRSDFEQWIPLTGTLEAAHPMTFRAELDGVSKLTFLAEDGDPVLAGDVLAQFDRADLEDRERTLTRDRDIALAHFTSLKDAEHPLELQRIQQEIVALESDIQKENLLRKETKALVDEELLAQEEVDAHDQTLSTLQSRKEALEKQADLTRRILHPSALAIAEARLTAATAGLERVHEELSSTVVTAPSDGSVHLPLIPIDGERRPARIGDGLYRNQVYLQLADLTELVIRAEVGERNLASVLPGMEVQVEFPAFPERRLSGRIATVGAYPRGGDRRYPVEIRLSEPADDLRPGMTARLHVLSDREEMAMVVPRAFLDWEGSELFIHTRKGRKSVEPGPGNRDGVLVRSGLPPGTVLLKP